MTIKGSITLLDRLGVEVSFEINGDNPKHFDINKVKKQKEMGVYGYTPVDIPAGGINLPWANHDNFDWNALGARLGKRNMVVDGETKEVDVVWYRGQPYTRRDWVNIKIKGQKMPDAIIYSRGAKGNDEDSEKASGADDGVGNGYVVLIKFSKFKNMPEDFKYPEWDKDDAEYGYHSVSYRQQEPEKRSYIQLKNLVKEKLEAIGRDASDENINKNILAKAKKLLDKEVDSVFKLSPNDNYRIYIDLGGKADESAKNNEEEKAVEENTKKSTPTAEPAKKPAAPSRPATVAAKSTPAAKAAPSKAEAKPAQKASTKKEPVQTKEPEPEQYDDELDLDIENTIKRMNDDEAANHAAEMDDAFDELQDNSEEPVIEDSEDDDFSDMDDSENENKPEQNEPNTEDSADDEEEEDNGQSDDDDDDLLL